MELCAFWSGLRVGILLEYPCVMPLTAESKRETKIAIKFTSNEFRKFELKNAMLRAYILRGKGYSHIFTSNYSFNYYSPAIQNHSLLSSSMTFIMVSMIM
jgi:hypothetical protein